MLRDRIRNVLGDHAIIVSAALMLATTLVDGIAHAQKPIDRTPEYIQAARDEALQNSCTILMPDGPEKGVFQTNFWPCNAVYYEFDVNTDLSMQTAALDAMAEIEASTSISFLPRTAEPNYLNIRDAAGNSSVVGMVGGLQHVNIVSWSFRFIIAHELMHALGIWHEQQRADRDSSVDIVDANIQPGREGNFTIAAGTTTSGTYDFDSIMHYGQCFFSTDCPSGSSCNCALGTETILVLSPNEIWQNLIGQRDHLSVGDLDTMNAMYPFTSDCNGNGLLDECDIAAAAFTYARDDGDGNGGLGTSGGGDIIWLNQFDVVLGGETIDTIEIAWGSVSVGTLTTLVLWDDPNNDGDPSDATVILTVPSVPAANPGADTLTQVAIAPTFVGSAGDSFFVGALITHPSGQNPARYDNTVSQVSSWFALNGSGLGDINNLPANGLFSQADAAGLFVNFMVRATRDTSDTNANGVYDDCDIARGDSNLDGVVGIDDFLAILAKWGPCNPSPCPEDSGFDGFVGIDDFLTILANWG